MKDILKIIRVRQWTKNFFVFIPMFFGGSLFYLNDWQASALTFIAFCLAASAIYCLNDIIDVDADRRHPKKCHRPIASGLVGKGEAYTLFALLAILSVVVPLFLVSVLVAMVVAIYLLINIAYCIRLKQYAIIDVCIVAMGFVLRIVAGGYATDIVLSRWIVMMTFLRTLGLSFTKLRDEVRRRDETGEAPRKNTIRYNLTFINQAITITGAVMLVCYIMYTVSPEVIERFQCPNLYMTSFFVVLGLLRYIQLTVVDEKSGDPTRLILSDRFVQLVVLGWILSFVVIIYM